jgi:hypothetical protein
MYAIQNRIKTLIVFHLFSRNCYTSNYASGGCCLRSRPASVPFASVSQDWRMPLKGIKSHTYICCLQHLESIYGMFSVNLDEALGLWRKRQGPKAYQVLSVAPALCDRLTQPLVGFLRTMLQHAKHFGIAPNFSPLDAENFQNWRSQRVALFNGLFSRVLLTRKSQFVHKISALADLVEELGESFESTATNLASGDSSHSDRDWELLDSIHYDLNTCLREAVVLFKSFLHALPEQQLAGFQEMLDRQAACTSSPRTRAQNLAHRRIAFLKGQ